MAKFPVIAPKARVVKALARLGFDIVREHEHISLARTNVDGSTTTMTIPNHVRLKGSTLRRVCSLAGIGRDEFLEAYQQTGITWNRKIASTRTATALKVCSRRNRFAQKNDSAVFFDAMRECSRIEPRSQSLV